MSTFLSSLRVRMILIVVVALIPAWAMMLYNISARRTVIESEVMKESLRAAELVAGKEEQLVEGARQVLTALDFVFHTFPEVRSNCDAVLRRLAGALSQYSDLGAVTPQGDIACSASPHPEDLNLAGSSWFQSVLHSRRFTLGDDPAGKLAGKPVLVAASPVIGSESQVEYVLFAAINPDRLDDFPMPGSVKSIEGSFFALVDPNGVVLSLYPRFRKEAISLQDDKLVAALRQGGSRVIVGEGSPGSNTIYSISPVTSRSPFRTVSVVLGMDRARAFAEADRMRNRDLGMLGLVSVFVLGAFWLLCNSVFLRRLGALVAGAQRLAEGDLKTRSGLAHQKDELGHLAKTFDGMAQALERRDREHEEAEARIRSSEDQLRRLQTHVQQVREEERIRLAREIHDHLGQALTALKIDLSWLSKKGDSVDTRTMRSKLDGMSQIIDDAMNTVHHVASELRPRILDDLGLAEAIEWQTEEFRRRTGIPCDVSVGNDDLDLSPEQATAFFRIFQEALTNVARHSGATRVAVSLDADSERVTLFVSDNGRGIHAEEIDSPLSYGLLGIRERAFSLGGEVEITGEEGSGTRLGVSIPRAPG